nr:MAG TPA: hypothetical protein [Bacteriophage sp.]
MISTLIEFFLLFNESIFLSKVSIGVTVVGLNPLYKKIVAPIIVIKINIKISLSKSFINLLLPYYIKLLFEPKL